MTIEINENLEGSILDIGVGGETVIGQIYKDRVRKKDGQFHIQCKKE